MHICSLPSLEGLVGARHTARRHVSVTTPETPLPKDQVRASSRSGSVSVASVEEPEEAPMTSEHVRPPKSMLRLLIQGAGTAWPRCAHELWKCIALSQEMNPLESLS